MKGKFLAALLSACLFVGATATAFAAPPAQETQSATYGITAFANDESAFKEKTVKLNTTLEDLKLPETIKAKVYEVGVDTETTEIDLPVEWTSNPNYDASKESTYTFKSSAKEPNIYLIADDTTIASPKAEFPSIKVTVATDGIAKFIVAPNENGYLNPHADAAFLSPKQQAKFLLEDGTALTISKNSNDKAATIDEKDKTVLNAAALAEGKSERTLLTLTTPDGKKSYTYRVEVGNITPNAYISFSQVHNLFVNETIEVTASIRKGNEVVGKAVITSESPEIVAYDATTGKVTAKAAGTAILKAVSEDGKLTSRRYITVVPAEYKDFVNAEYSLDGKKYSPSEGKVSSIDANENMESRGAIVRYWINVPNEAHKSTLYVKVKTLASESYSFGVSASQVTENADGSYAWKSYTKFLSAESNGNGVYTIAIPAELLNDSNVSIFANVKSKSGIRLVWNFVMNENGIAIKENYPIGTYTSTDKANTIKIDKDGKITFNGTAIVNGTSVADSAQYAYYQNLDYYFTCDENILANLESFYMGTPYKNATDRWQKYLTEAIYSEFLYIPKADSFTAYLEGEDGIERQVVFQNIEKPVDPDAPDVDDSGSTPENTVTAPSTPSPDADTPVSFPGTSLQVVLPKGITISSNGVPVTNATNMELTGAIHNQVFQLGVTEALASTANTEIKDIFELNLKDAAANQLLSDVTFDKPVKITTNVSYASGYNYTIYYSNDNGSTFAALVNANVSGTGGKLSFETNHFTVFAVVATKTVTTGGYSTGGGSGFSSYWITAKAGSNGSITPAGETKVSFGDSVTYKITPNSGYAVDKVLIDNTKEVTLVNGEYTFKNVNEPYTITATFKKASGSVTVPDGSAAVVMPVAPNPATGDSWFSHLFDF